MKMIFRIIFLLVIVNCQLFGQIISGKITFERKVNLYKKLKGDWVKDYIKETDKIKIEYFDLYFNDTISLFKPQETELRDNMEWATSKNVVYQNFNKNNRYVILRPKNI